MDILEVHLSKGEVMTKQEAIKIINKVGEDFGWQMGKVGANYENGYMKAIRDVKNAFEHIVEANKMIVSEEKMRMLEENIKRMCESEECINCGFFNLSDEGFRTYPCSIMDKYKNLPFNTNWDFESAFLYKRSILNDEQYDDTLGKLLDDIIVTFKSEVE